MMSDDPWKDIAPPAAIGSINAKRVDPDVRWGFFWGRSIDRKCLFVLTHAPDVVVGGRLPNLRGVEITDVPRSDHEHMLMFKLLEDVHRDIFQRLCRDIVSATTTATNEAEALALCLNRTWRWHHLLRGGGDTRLSVDEQKGLAGELLVIERHLLSCLTPRSILESWRGPLDAPKDFEIGRICVEAKARRGAATPHIAISSADQLDISGVDELFLYVVDVDQAPADTASSFTITDLAGRVRDRLLSTDASVSENLDRLLSAAGFEWSDDYSDTQFVEGSSQLFRVTEDFPRISSSALASGIGNVRYSISLQDCVPFAIDSNGLVDALRARLNDG